MMYALLAILAALVLIFFIPVRLWFDYKHRGKSEDTFLLQFSFPAGLLRYSIEVPVVSSSEKGLSLAPKRSHKGLRFSLPTLLELGRYWRHYSLMRRSWAGRFFRRRFKLRHFVWHTELGLEQPDQLAVLTGCLWAVKGIICAGLHHVFSFPSPPVLRVLPRFNRNYFRVSFSCILEFPLGYAIITAFLAICRAVKLKMRKRGERNDRTSNSRSDEDGHGKHQGNGGCEYCNR